MFFYGGMDRVGKVLDDLQALNFGTAYPDSMSWLTPQMSKRSAKPGPRSAASFTVVYNHEALSHPTMDLFNPPKVYDEVFTPSTCGVYLIGGVNEKGVACNDVYVLKGKKMSVRDDRPSLMWLKLELSGVPPDPRYDHSACLCGKSIFIYGGRDDALFSSASHCEVKSFAALNIECQRWDRIEILGSPPSGRWGLAMAAIDTRIFIFGGMKLSKFCSSKLNIVETDQGVVQDRAAVLKATKKKAPRHTVIRTNRHSVLVKK